MAKMEKWRDDPEEELVKIFQRSELSTFWTSNIDLIIGPGETLVWIRDGKIEDIVTQARLNNVAGGFRNWIASKSTIYVAATYSESFTFTWWCWTISDNVNYYYYYDM